MYLRAHCRDDGTLPPDVIRQTPQHMATTHTVCQRFTKVVKHFVIETMAHMHQTGGSYICEVSNTEQLIVFVHITVLSSVLHVYNITVIHFYFLRLHYNSSVTLQL